MERSKSQRLRFIGGEIATGARAIRIKECDCYP
jgi:hypothetical protein